MPATTPPDATSAPSASPQQFGHYQIVAKIGAGGMGEVYRAHDTRLNRDVAVKVLPRAFAEDPLRMARFEREAQLLASLNHPKIAAIYGLEESGATLALVMELVEGSTLAERIADGPVPLDEAVPLIVQMADALAYAHDRGIIHRDLKPANIKLTSDGQVKILDFGLAKAMSINSSGASPDATTLPVTTSAGMVLGTAAYMSPEQARGQEMDRRTDVWSFGVVVYEMLLGQRPFRGPTVSDTVAAVLRETPSLERVPLYLRRLVAACLEKEPRKRLRDLGDVRLLLGIFSEGSGASSIAGAVAALPRSSALRRSLPWAAAAVLFALAVILAVAYYRTSSRPQRTIRSLISAPEAETFAFGGFNGLPTLSPDGTRLVFPSWDNSGHEALWVRRLDSLTAARLQGTDDASYPFWSPESNQLAFFQDNKLKKIDLAGGPPVLLCDAPNARGGTWSRRNLIVFASGMNELESVSGAGGNPTPVASHTGSGAGFSNRWPEFLPDAKHFLYLSGELPAAGTSKLGIYVGEIGSKESKFLFQADSGALYAPPGYLLFLRGDTLMAQQFDADSRKLKGEALPVAQHVASPALFRQGLFSVSETGLLIYETAGTYIGGQLAWFDARGKQLAEVGEPGPFDLSLSPDGKQLAYVLQRQTGAKNDDIWLMDLQRNVQTRFTFGPSDNKLAVWSPDGASIAYSCSPQSRYDLCVASTSGTGVPQMLSKSDADEYPTDWSRDGRYIAVTFSDRNGQTNSGLWVLPLFGSRKPFPYLQSRFNKSDAVFSPDGRWLAYSSDESGSLEVYLSPFPSGNGKWQVSRNGGDQPEWNREGSALYYLAPGGKMMEASVKENGAAVVVSEPRELFQATRAATSLGARSYCVSKDGKRFLVAEAPQIEASPLTLVTNWTTDLKK
ncbi:MAG: protein kinase domain-containing protein [Terracidiphilus sp.]